MLLLAAVLAAIPAAPASAQDCDYKMLQAWWSEHPSPDSIYVNYIADVEGPVSADPQKPSHYDMMVAIRFNSIPVIPDQQMTLVRWATPNNCGGSCPLVVCRHEEWVFKGVPIIQESKCLPNAQNVCGCPPLGTPVPHQKPVPKPPGPVTIEIELIPLSLQSCNPIRPENDKTQIPYPQQQQSVPGLPRPALTVLALLLVSLGSMATRWRRGEAA
jgi:hypothetical protein